MLLMQTLAHVHVWEPEDEANTVLQSLPSTRPQAPATCLFTAGIRTARAIFRLFLHRLWRLNSGPQHFRQGAIPVLQVGLSNSPEYWQISVQRVVCLFVFTV